MRNRKHYVLASMLVTCALACHFIALSKISQPSRARALAVSLKLPKEEAGQATLKAELDAKNGQTIYYAGLFLAVCGGVFCVLSALKHEPVSRSVPCALLGFYIITLFLLI